MEHVWKALTDPDEIAKYMMGARITTDRNEGSPIVWRGEWKGKPFEDMGRVPAYREPDLLRYAHRSGNAPDEEHIVTIEMKDVAGVTHVRLTQDNNTTQEAADKAQANWSMMLDGLKVMLGEAPVAPPEVPRV